MAMVLESIDCSQRFPLDGESIFVGRSEWKSDICLDDSGIADVHCELTPQMSGIRLVAMTDQGVTVNGKPVREATLVMGDEIGIAQMRFRLTEDRVHKQPTESTKASQSSESSIDPQQARWLVRMSGMHLGPVDWDELQAMIGRGEIRLDDEVQRENDSQWQTVRSVLPKAGGDVWLGGDTSVERSDDIPRRTRTSRRVLDGRTPPEGSVSGSGGESESLDSVPEELSLPLAPQFYIMRDGAEVGPLPRRSVQDLADDGSLTSDTPVRLEDSDDWSTARAVGIRCSSSPPTANTDSDLDSEPGNEMAGRLAWALLAPYYLVIGLIRSTASIEPRRLVMGLTAVLIVVAVSYGWFRSWSQTAIRGQVTLDGKPVDSVLVQLTGASTGDSAIGVTSSDGSFRMVTLDGDLKPGLYLVTVRPVSSIEGGIIPDTATVTDSGLPQRYHHINTTDAVIEISADQSQYSIELTKQRPSGAGPVGFRGAGESTPHALP